MNTYGLIGFPLTHSFSATYFNSKFKKENISNAVFNLYPLNNINELPLLLERETELKGLSVTIPYKKQIIPFLDEMDETASKIGAVNSVKIIRQHNIIKLKGYNTDVIGFEEILLPNLKPFHTKALVLGNGGASKAVCFVLNKHRISYQIVSRNPAKDQLSYSGITEKVMADNLLIINTTPLGMYPNINECPDIPYELLHTSHLLIDLIYNPEETLFLKKAGLKAANTQNGMKMLIAQADASWKLWNARV
jgi:shikimate dehydrogenase